MDNIIKEKILENKIIAIVRGVGKDNILKTVEALLNGGIKLIEVTYNHQSKEKLEETLQMIKMINNEYKGDVFLGAGTVLTAEQVLRAVEAGAEYIISPNTDSEVIKKTKELCKISIPGAFTASEVVTAYNLGADLVKLFPAGLLGTEYIKAIRGPLNHIPLLVTGGVDLNNINKFMKVGAAGAGIGGSLVNKANIDEGEFHKIKLMAQEYVSAIKCR